MSKGITYGGILYLASHPASDIHGLVRAVLRTKNPRWLFETLQALDVPNPTALWRAKLWGESVNVIEQLVTEPNYGRMMVCPVASMYVDPSKYIVLDSKYFKVAQASKTA